ncbi:MAG: M23 family metallopeptidase [Bacteroidota bacterium]
MKQYRKYIYSLLLLFPVAIFWLPIPAFESFFSTGNTLHDTIVEPDTVPGENRVFQSIEYMTEEQVYTLIDSLLDEVTIPLELINEINLYVTSKYDKTTGLFATEAHNPSVYPANNYYFKWDTYNTHPYSELLSKNDTTVLLVLQDSSSRYIPPVIGIITSNFGDRRNHLGIDIDLEVWDTVVSAFDGMVRIARKHGGYGRVVVVRHYNGLETFYGHLHRIKVQPGDTVKAGQLVGLGGSSGKSTGSHLHFECRFKGKPLNAMHFIDFKENKLIGDTIILTKTRWSYSVYPKGVKFHTVAYGEFLYLIAKRYGTTIRRLCELNGISRNSILRVGQKLRIG